MIRFKSIKNGNKIAYCVSSGSSDTPMHFYSNPRQYISSSVQCYETYGDGMTQHSNTYSVSSTNMEDFLISFAMYLNEHPEDIEFLNMFFVSLFDDNPDRIKFFAGLVYDPDKVTYYNEGDLKVSRSEKKVNDRRWEKVPSWANGSVEAVLIFMTQSYWGALKRFVCTQAVRPILNYQWYDYGKHFGIESPSEEFSNIQTALDAIRSMWKAYRHTDLAKRRIESLKLSIKC